MRKLISFIIFAFIVYIANAQQTTDVKYTKTELQGKSISGADKYSGYTMYAAGRYQMYIDGNKQRLAIKSTGKEVFTWEADEQNEFTKYAPSFFIPDYKNFPILLMIEEIIDGSSNGQHVFLMDKGKAYYCGFINLAADKGDGASIAKYAIVNMKSGKIYVTFSNDASIFCWENYEVYKGKDVSFEIDLRSTDRKIEPSASSLFKDITSNSENTIDTPVKIQEKPTTTKEEYTW